MCNVPLHYSHSSQATNFQYLRFFFQFFFQLFVKDYIIDGNIKKYKRTKDYGVKEFVPFLFN